MFLDFEGKPTTRNRSPSLPTTNDLRLEYLTKARVFEGFARHMYRDPECNVTIGIGHLLPNVEAALRLQRMFVHKKTRKQASRDDIKEDFNAVRTSKSACGTAGHYASETHLEISEDNATSLAQSDIEQKLHEIKHYFPHFETYPQPAQLGVLDMVFNAGIGTTLDVFTQFTGAVRQRNWKLAAEDSNRPQAETRRNTPVREWFLEAARVEPCFVNPGRTIQLEPSLE